MPVVSLQLPLRERGHDAVAAVEAGLAGEPDERIRAYAIDTGRILLTLDADFANILRFPPAETPGVTIEGTSAD
jgi:predicted nuclease of predicted toxin-antitoxin system